MATLGQYINTMLLGQFITLLWWLLVQVQPSGLVACIWLLVTTIHIGITTDHLTTTRIMAFPKRMWFTITTMTLTVHIFGVSGKVRAHTTL